MILYADAVLVYSASTPLKLYKILQRDFSLISDWYTDNRSTLNVKKTNIILAGSKTMLLKFEDFDFSLEGGQIDRVLSFNYLGVILDQLGHWLSLFNRILHMLEKRTRLAYFNGLVLPLFDYANTV